MNSLEQLEWNDNGKLILITMSLSLFQEGGTVCLSLFVYAFDFWLLQC